MRTKRLILPLLAAACLLMLAPGSPAFAQSGGAKNKNKDKKAENLTTRLLIHGVGGDKGKAVKNASVYLRFEEKGELLFLLHRKHKVELDLKTDREGHASFPELPQGKVLIQVVAPGWQTFGEYFKLDKAKQTIQIKLHRPKTRWY
jgi:hypothetical protein